MLIAVVLTECTQVSVDRSTVLVDCEAIGSSCPTVSSMRWRRFRGLALIGV